MVAVVTGGVMVLVVVRVVVSLSGTLVESSSVVISVTNRLLVNEPPREYKLSLIVSSLCG